MADPNAPAGLGAGGEQLPQPPPLHPAVVELLRRSEDSRQTHNQILQTLVQNMANQGGGGNPRRGYPAFLATEPPIFQGSKEPLDADFWLSAIEEKFGLFPCDDQEKVAFAAHQLRDAAGVWWKSYKTQIAQGHQITWDEFRQVFRAHHIPASVVAIKREEFLKLTQGNRSV